MYTRLKKSKENDSLLHASKKSQLHNTNESAFQITDNRPTSIAQSNLQQLVNGNLASESVRGIDTDSPVIQGVFRQTDGNSIYWRDTEDDAVYKQIQVIYENQTQLEGADGQTFYIQRDAKSGNWIRRPTTQISDEKKYQLAEGHLTYLRNALPPFGKENDYTWIRRITGGGSGTLSGKRNKGGIKTDMSEAEYQAILDISKGFYDTSAELDLKVPRDGYIQLYRGFTIPKIRNSDASVLTNQMKNYIDVIPSSASWQPESANDMAKPGEAEDSVLVYLLIPPEHPIVIMSYPDNKNPADNSKPKALDLKQAEVMIGASTQKNVRILKTENLKGGNTRYHVSAELQAMTESAVKQGVINARELAQESRASIVTVDIEYKQLQTRFGPNVAAKITQESKGNVFKDLKGNKLRLAIFDDGRFGCTFEVL